jgi:hypothetical protein
MKTWDRDRLRALDQAGVPNTWPEIERRATVAAGSNQAVLFQGDATSSRRRITAMVVALALGGASLLLVFTVFGGLNDGTPASPPGIFFPTLKEPANGYPAALAVGTLTNRNGCIVLQQGTTELLLIWPYGTTLQQDQTGALRVWRSDGSLIAKVGDYVNIGGGAVGEAGRELHFVEQLIGKSVPSRCWVGAGGYFMTSGDATEPLVGS